MLRASALQRVLVTRSIDDAQPVLGAHARSNLRVVSVVLLAAFAVTLLVINIFQSKGAFGWDFHAFYEAGRRYLHLETPYSSGSLAELTSQRNFVYPLPVAALFAPISLLPYTVAAVLFVLTSGVLLVAALHLLGVRDPRCYGALLIGAPAFSGLEIGTISPILVFLLALTWRYRDRTLVTAVALTLLVLAKLFLWPVAVWLVATRRSKSVILTVAASAVAVMLASVPLGLGVLEHYPSLLRTVSDLEGRSSLSLVALGTAAAGSAPAGTALSLAGGALLLLGVARFGRQGDDLRSFRFSVVAALALTPILWNHYLLLLYVPLALTRRRFSPVWLGSAWVLSALNGGTVGGGRLAVTVAAVWFVVLLQSGLLPRVDFRSPYPRLAEAAGGLALWASLIWGLVALLGVVPAVAALRSSSGTASPSGTATVRLFRAENKICFRIVTDGVSRPAVAQIVQGRSRRVLVERPMGTTQLDACAEYHAGAAGNLANAFAAKRVHLSLRVISSSGQALLSGPVVEIQDSVRRATPISR